VAYLLSYGFNYVAKLLSVSNSFLCFFINQVVSVVLENYGSVKKNSDALTHGKQDAQKGHVEEASPSPDAMTRISSWRMIVSEKGEVNVPV
jgi:hypothetical protein